ncbi:MAG TPA: alpha/beta hydrolase [Noviherbaspirillum sp.]|nr:alpha/beta hydrolase [Noviherbaspirillum sp.]
MDAELLVRQMPAAGARSAVAARLYAPAGARAAGLVVLFPCGGFETADLDAVDGLATGLARASGYRVLASTYTTAPVQPFPAAAEDAYAVLAWAMRERAGLGWDGRRLIAAGMEAGGNLAAVAALMARDRGGPRIAGQMLLMPMLDPGLCSESMRQRQAERVTASEVARCVAAYRGYLPHAADRMHPYACPLQVSRLKGLPPALILSVSDDPLRDEAEQYGAKLAAAGVRTTLARLAPAAAPTLAGVRCDEARSAQMLEHIVQFLAGLDVI